MSPVFDTPGKTGTLQRVSSLNSEGETAGVTIKSEPALIARIDGLVRDRVLGRYDDRLVVPGHFAKDGGLRGAAMLHANQSPSAAQGGV